VREPGRCLRGSLLLSAILAACASGPAPITSASQPSASAVAPAGITLKPFVSEPVGQDNVETLAFSPDGKHLAVGAGDGIVAIYPLAGGPGEEPVVQKLHAGFVSGLAWSPDGRSLASAAGDGTVRLSDPQTLVPARSFTGVPSSRPALAWSADGAQVAVAQGRGAVQTYDTVTGAAIDTFSLPGATRDLRWLSSGELAVGDDGGQVSFLASGKQARVFRPATAHKSVNSLSLSPDGSQLAIGYDDGAIVLVDPASATAIRELPKGRQVGTVSWSPNGKLLAVSSVAFDLRLLDAQGGQLAKEDVGYDVNGTAWSPDGSMVAAAADDHTFKLWQVNPPQTPSKMAPTPASYMGR
jgi:WD40 repeat protein